MTTKNLQTEIWYRKVGRRYVPVKQAELSNYDVRPANGCVLTFVKDGATMFAHDVKPDTAGFVAAAMVARNAMEVAIHEATKFRPSSGLQPFTKKQQKLIKQFQADMGGMHPVYWVSQSSYKIAQAGIDAVTDLELIASLANDTKQSNDGR